MALPFTDPSQFVTYDGPNGPIAIPSQFASSFQLPQPSAAPPMVTAPPAAGTPTGPLPTFDAAELAPPPAPAAPQPTDPATPVPSTFTPSAPAAEPNAFITPDEASQLPMPAAPKQKAQAPAQPPTAIELAMAANRNRQQIAGARGDVESRAAQAEEQIYKDSDKREAALEAAREAERQREAKEREKARAEAKEAADRAANYKIDENRRWNNLSTGRKLLAGIGVIMAGLGNALAKKGDARNPALDFIMETLKEDTRLQMDERAQLQGTAQEKKNYLSELRSQFSDNEAAFQASLAANTKFVANKLRTAAAGAKSETARLNAIEGAELLEGEAAQLLDRAEERQYQRNIDDRNYKVQMAQLGEQRRGREQAQANADRAFNQGVYEFERTMGVREQQAMVDAAKARAEGNAKEAERIEKKAKEERQEAVFSPKGEVLTQKDGSTWLTGDTARATKLRDQVSNVSKMTAMADKLIALRGRHGWSSNLFNSPEFQEMKQVYADMVLTEKDVRALGAISGPDLVLMTNVLGAEDPTQYKDPTPALKSFRDGSVRNVNKYLRGQGYNGKPVEFPSLRDTDPGLAAFDDKDVQSVLQYDESKRGVLGGRSSAIPVPGGINQIGAFSIEPGKLNQLADRGKSMVAGYTQKQENTLLNFADRAADGDVGGRANLEAVAKSSTVPELRAIATELLKQVDSGAYESRPAQIRSAVSKVRAALGAPVKE